LPPLSSKDCRRRSGSGLAASGIGHYAGTTTGTDTPVGLGARLGPAVGGWPRVQAGRQWRRSRPGRRDEAEAMPNARRHRRAWRLACPGELRDSLRGQPDDDDGSPRPLSARTSPVRRLNQPQPRPPRLLPSATRTRCANRSRRRPGQAASTLRPQFGGEAPHASPCETNPPAPWSICIDSEAALAGEAHARVAVPNEPTGILVNLHRR
jgi:hypothetical protein